MEVEVTGKLEVEQKGQAGKQENTAMQDELLKQLHEQYAVNNNANLGTIVTLVVAVIAVIGYFGYVYVHTGVDFSKDFGCLVKSCGEFYLDALLLIYLASVLILGILTCLCAYQGVAQRKEQFIIHNIRKECWGDEFLNNSKIFPSDYKPDGKTGLKVVQGLYGELIKIFVFLFFVLTSMVLIKLYLSDSLCFFCRTTGMCERSVTLVFTAVVVAISWWYCCSQIKSYHKRENKTPTYAKDKCEKCCIKCILSKIQEMRDKTNQTNNQKTTKQ